MADIANTIVKAKEKPPNSAFLSSLAFLINYCMKITVSGELLTATQAATTIEGWRDAIEALTVHASGGSGFLKHLSNHLQMAYDKSMMDNTDIAAFTTINTAQATTDVLYGLCTQHDAKFDALWGEINGQSFAPYIPGYSA